MSDIRPVLSNNARMLLEQRYLKRNDDRQIVESPHDMCVRIADWISNAELEYGGKEKKDKYFWEFLDALLNLEIIPSSPYMFNCGVSGAGLFSCFVVPINDSIEDIYKCVADCAKIYQATGGIGVDMSPIREEGAIVKRSKGYATGPLSFLGVMNSSAYAVNHGGHRRAASLAAMDIDHPDIEKFIEAKSKNLPEIIKLREIILRSSDKVLVNFAKNELDKMQQFTLFNFSVKITDKFMQAVANDTDWSLISRLDGRVVSTIKAKKLFRDIVKNAWRSAEPGIIFIDNVNKDNPLPQLGRVECCNPCGEQYLHPYQACNLVTINLNKVVEGKSINWDRLAYLAALATRFSDNAIDVSGYPIPEIEKAVKSSRRIGIGIMGLADVFITMRLPYDSEDARQLAAKIMKHVRHASIEESRRLAKERGVFELWSQSIWGEQKIKVRNCAFTSIQPNGSTSIIANASASAEPLFNVYYIRRTGDGKEMVEVHESFVEDIKKIGLNIDTIIRQLEQCGSIQEIADIPDDIKKIYKCAHDISPEAHILMQAAIQPFVDGGISKTINMPADISENEVSDVYQIAWEKGCKGVTIYREGCRNSVLSTKSASIDDYERRLATFLYDKYHKEELSCREIADILNVSVTTVFTRLKKYGIKRRSIEDIKNSKNKKISPTLRNVIYGNLLGTSKITKVQQQGSYRHITKHLDYANYVRDLFVDQGIACTDIMSIHTDIAYFYFDTEFLTDLAPIEEMFFENEGIRIMPEIELTSEIIKYYYLSEGTKTEKGGIRLDKCCINLQRKMAKTIGIEVIEKSIESAYIPKKYVDMFYQYIEGGQIDLNMNEKCPECGSDLEYKEHCKTCPKCGWGACSV